MFKRQIFIFGASVAYGVGGTQGGWSGLLKQYVHSELYGKDHLGEKVEVYNFAKPGAEIGFVSDTFENQLLSYERDCPLTAFILVGLNDTKAVNAPETYLSNDSKFKKDYRNLLSDMSKYFEAINVLGFYDVDENKVYPKVNPFDGTKSYFKNDRIHIFNEVLKQVCSCFDKVNFIDMSNLDGNWVDSCLFKDGLHPNDKGHELIFDAVKDFIKL